MKNPVCNVNVGIKFARIKKEKKIIADPFL